MQKLRDIYVETQTNANANFDKVTQERVKKVLVYTYKEEENMNRQDNFTNVEELLFYREKFKKIDDIFNQSIQQGYKKNRVQNQVKAVLSDNFKNQTRLPDDLGRNQVVKKISSIAQPRQLQKEVFNSFFDNKIDEIQKSKIGFKSVLQNNLHAQKRYPVKPQKGSIINNDEEIRRLQGQIQRLKRQLSERDNEKQFNMGLLQVQKKAYEQQINDLGRQVEDLHNQNSRLKQQTARNFPHSNQYYPVMNIPQPEPQIQQYNPYKIKYKQNDIYKIKSKQIQARQNVSSKPNQINTKTYNHPIKEESLNNSKRYSENFDIINQSDNQDRLNRKNSNSIIRQPSNLNFNKSEIADEPKNIAFRSKIAFFKNPMVLYRGMDFEIAVKVFEITRLQSKRIIIYVNNKQNIEKQIKCDYKYDKTYYDLVVDKKMTTLPRKNQSKQQISVRLINQIDLDSLIEVNLAVNDKEIVFLLPTMFLQFVDRKTIINILPAKCDKQRINPMNQFSNMHSASQILPIEKQYGEREEKGVLYAVSKHHQGVINLRWVQKQIQIQTIKPWKLFFSYLLLRDY